VSETGNAFVRQSLQSCQVEDNASVIREKLGRVNRNSALYNTLLGLNGVLQHLMSWVPSGNNDQIWMRSSMPFDEAYEVYNSFFPNKGFTHQEKQQFRDALLHPDYGLKSVYFHEPH